MIFVILFLIFNFCHLNAGENYYSIFEEVLYSQPKPIVQLQFPYTIDTDYSVTSITGLSTSGSGTVTQGTGMALLSTSTTLGSAAVLASKARLSYKPGQGLETIFSAVFDIADANNTQYIGVGNSRDGFFFGYNGTTFGVLHRNNSVDTWISQASFC